MKKIFGFSLFVLCALGAYAQVDTSFVYNTSTPYGTLDIRIAKSATRYYYLQENVTFSFRESSPGVKTNTYFDMTSWDSSPYTQGNMKERNGTKDNFILNYRLLFPQNYDPNFADGYPLIVMMPGAGERANCWDNNCYWADRTWKPTSNSPAAPTDPSHRLLNNDHNLLHGGQVHLSARNLNGTRLPNDPTIPSRAFPGFILFTQSLNGWDSNTVQDAIRLIRLITKKYKIDQNKIYIHGLSNGGYGVYEAVKRAPWLFAAALPMSAIGDASIVSRGLTSQVSNIPFWIFQGGRDTNPLPAKTESFVKKLREAGTTVRYNNYSNLGHGVWNTAYNEPDFFSWMLQQNKSNLHVFADLPAICRTTNVGAKLELAAGFLAYQWEKDGQLIPGANSAKYEATEPGVYRARFSRVANPVSESQWNKWSNPVTVTENNPSQAQVQLVGTAHLKGLDNLSNARINAIGDFDHYYWYKDGALVNLPGDQDDTTRYAIFKAGTCSGLPQCTGNGLYTLVTAGYDNCPSPPSEPIRIWFNNQAPINITAPLNFTGNATSASTATLNWTDASNNESGFEVWRRRVTGPGTFSIWTLAARTGENITSLNDSGLEPLSTYQYKIRAIGLSGRSNYTPTSSTQFLVINTLQDVQPPSPPTSVSAQSNAIKSITLNWNAAIDNTGIRQYHIFFNNDTISTGSSLTSYTFSNLDLNTEYSFTIKAEDLGGNLSEFSNAAIADTYVTGLYYEHSTGAWTDLDLINWDFAEYVGRTNNFGLSLRTQEDYFNFEFYGYVYINTGGIYQFRTTSDDGSRLILNNLVIVENDGLHGNVTITSANQTLASGPQSINVRYFEYNGGQTLTVQYRGPDTGNNWVNIPDSALKSGNRPGGSSSRIAENSSLENIVQAKDISLVVSAYPNPTNNDNIYLEIDSSMPGPIEVKLLDVNGRLHYSNNLDEGQRGQTLRLEPYENLQNGIYIIVATQGNVVKHQKILIKE